MDVPEHEMDTFTSKLLTYKMIVAELGKETIDRNDTTNDDFTDLDFYVDKVSKNGVFKKYFGEVDFS